MVSKFDLELGRRYRTAAQERYPEALVEVRLYGSRARGDARPDSDLDLFVLTRGEDPATRRDLQTLAWEVETQAECPYPILPLVMSVDHFEELRRRERRLARDILKEGLLV